MAKPGSRSLREQLDEVKYEIQAAGKYGKQEPSPYIYHEALIRIAGRTPPKDPTPKFTSFSDWVFGLYHSTHDPSAMRIGKAGEEIVEMMRMQKKRLATR